MSDLKAIMHQIRFPLGFCPRLRWGAHSAPLDPLAGFKGSYFKGKGGKRGQGTGKQGKGKRRERNGEGKGIKGKGEKSEGRRERKKKGEKKDRNGIGLRPRKALIRLCSNYLFSVNKALRVVVKKIKSLALQTSLLRPRWKQVTERYTWNAVEKSTSVIWIAHCSTSRPCHT